MKGTVTQLNSEELEVHHIVSIDENSDLSFDVDNLITLCRLHHEMAEAEKLDKEKLKRIAKNNSVNDCLANVEKSIS